MFDPEMSSSSAFQSGERIFLEISRKKRVRAVKPRNMFAAMLSHPRSRTRRRHLPLSICETDIPLPSPLVSLAPSPTASTTAADEDFEVSYRFSKRRIDADLLIWAKRVRAHSNAVGDLKV